MIIGFDAKRIYNNTTGLGNYGRTLLDNLLEFEKDNDYYLYTPKKGEGYTPSARHTAQVHTCLPDNRRSKLWRSFGISRQMLREGIQLYHGLSNELPFTIKESTAKSVVTIHDLIFRVYPRTYKAFDRKMYDLKFRRSCELADRVVAISEHTRRDIIKYYGIPASKIQVVYQSCSPLFYNPVAAQVQEEVKRLYNLPAEYLLYVGSVEARKNLELILKAYAILPEAGRVPLLVVGKGKQYLQQMKKLAKSAGIEPWVIWKDNVQDNHHLQAIYASAQALIYPSKYEGFGLPIVEALLSKTPVITADTSALKEAGGAHSLYVHPDNPEEMAGAISAVLGDSALRIQMQEQGLLHATTQFSRERLTKEMYSLYTSLMEEY